MKAVYTIVLLIVSNSFMTLAWYGHLKLKDYSWFSGFSLFKVILFSWLIAFFEYCAQVPANRIGFVENGGPFNLWELKVIQEVITLVVFSIFTIIVFKDQTLKTNHLIGFVFLVLAVYFIFRK
ncbi:MAG: DMT family protein [Moheibacter sp.]